jgi:hypothetical protein
MYFFGAKSINEKNSKKGPKIGPKYWRQKEYYPKLIGTDGTRLLREKPVQGRPRRCGGPPAESECLEGKSTVKF